MPDCKPNIIFAFSDEHRWHSMAHTQMPELQTPNMTRMTQEGLECSQCISNYPVCSPYRGILMSGRWPQTTGVIDNGLPLSPDDDMLGAIFKRAGYHTGYIGKWHLGGLRAQPFGFDESLIWTGANHYWNASYHPDGRDEVNYEGYNPIGMTDQAIDFISRNASEPFFLALSWNPPHARFQDAPEEKKALYPEGSLSERPNGKGSEPGQFHKGWADYQGYHAHVSALDDELGRLLDAVDQRGLAEDTIVIFTSDHGSQLGSHGMGSKRQPYEESIRVPFIARAPGRIPPGQKSDVLLGGIDMLPTLCGLAGLEAPRCCPGRDLSPSIFGQTQDGPASQFIMHIAKDNASHGTDHPAPIFRGVRTLTHTYAVLENGETRLFDNTSDPYQMHNLAGLPEHTALQERLREQLKRYLLETGDAYVLKA